MTNRTKRRQAQYNIPELPEIDDENIAWIELHCKKRLFQFSQIATGHFVRLLHVQQREQRRRDVFERASLSQL